MQDHVVSACDSIDAIELHEPEVLDNPTRCRRYVAGQAVAFHKQRASSGIGQAGKGLRHIGIVHGLDLYHHPEHAKQTGKRAGQR